jgi:pilus assembly protein Flp/PilA
LTRADQSQAATGLSVPNQREESNVKLVQFLHSFIRDEDGAAAIEYGLIAALIAIAIIVGATLLGTSLDGLFTRLGNCMATPTVAVCSLVA